MKLLSFFVLFTGTYLSFSIELKSPASMYRIDLRGEVQVFENEGNSKSKARIEVPLRIRNQIDPALVFDHGEQEAMLFASVNLYAFLLIDGKYLASPLPAEGEGLLPLRSVLKYEGSKVDGKLLFDSPVVEPESLALFYYHENYGTFHLPIKGDPTLLKEPDASAISGNERLELSVVDHGVLEGQTAQKGQLYYFVDVVGRSKWSRQTPAFYLDAGADPQQRSVIDFPFHYQRGETVLNLIVDGEFARTYDVELSSPSGSLAFISDAWTQRRLVFSIPETYSQLDLAAQFIKMGTSDAGAYYAEAINVPVFNEGEVARELGVIHKVIDEAAPNKLDLKLALVKDLSAWGIDDQKYLGVYGQYKNSGSEPGMMKFWDRLSFVGTGNVSPINNPAINPYLAPEELYLDLDAERGFVVLFDLDAVREIEGPVISYSGIGGEHLLDVNIENLTLTPTDFDTVQQRIYDQAGATESKKFEQTHQSQPVATTPSRTPEAKEETPPSEEEKPYEAVVPFHLADIVPYHEDAVAKANDDLEGLRTSPDVFEPLSAFGFSDFEEQFGKASTFEAEPNDEATQASRFNIGQTVKGSVETKGLDYWKFSVLNDNGSYTVRFAVNSNGTDMKGAYFEIHTADSQEVLRQWVEQSYPRIHLALNKGDYYVKVSNYSQQPEAEYFFRVDQESFRERTEREVDNYLGQATSLKLGTQIRGTMDHYDQSDFFKIEFTEEDAELKWDFVVQTDQPETQFDLRFMDESEAHTYWVDGKGSLMAGDFSPDPGIYYVQLRARPQVPMQYRLKTINRGYRTAGWEREPNDNTLGQGVDIIETIDDGRPELLGRFQGRYGDFFGLNVKDINQLYTISVNAPKGTRLEYHNGPRGMEKRTYATDELAAALVDLRLPLGVSYFYIEGKEGDYAINIEANPIPGDQYEWEPNDANNRAQLMEFGKTYEGRLLDTYDEDWYRIVVEQPMLYRVELKAGIDGAINMELRSNGYNPRRIYTDKETGALVEEYYLLPANYYLRLDPSKPSLESYKLTVSTVSPFEGPKESEGLQLLAQDVETHAAAFVDEYQKVIQKVTVTNKSASSQNLKLLANSSHRKVQLHLDFNTSLNLKSGQSTTVELPWMVAPQLSDGKIQLFVAAEDTNGSRVLGQASLLLSTVAVPVGVDESYTRLDDRLLGGLNLNLTALGAEPIVPAKESYPGGGNPPSVGTIGHLMDGVLSNRTFYGYQAVCKLAGDGKIPIVGTSFDLQSGANLWVSAKDVTVAVSNDGVQFTDVLSVSLEPRVGEQAFVFDEAVKAKYARLTIHSAQNERAGQATHLGEWRMIASPNAVLEENQSPDLLAGANGGHHIYNDENLSWVFGFHHNRAARVSHFRWKNKGAERSRYFNSRDLVIEVSMDSPVGPWKKVGEFDLREALEGGFETTQSFEGEPWARFIRVTSLKPEDDKPHWQTYEAFQVFEKLPDESYRSILGEWGNVGKDAIYEHLERKSIHTSADSTVQRIQSTESQPYDLEADEWVESVAWVNESWEDWYRIQPLKSKKRLQLLVEGKPFVKVAVEVFDDQGQLVELQEGQGTSTQKPFTFLAEAGVSYKVHVYEPKRSIVYLWDVSGSMGAFIPSIENAVLKFAQEIDPNSEQVHLLPFDDPAHFLLEDWASDSYLLQNTVRNYKAPSSSYAHLNLLAATEKLADEIGTRAAIVITDCESGRGVNPELWQALKRERPAVFTFQTSDQTSAYRIEQDDMQDWAAVGGGFYYNTRSPHELDDAFARVQAYLRRPAPYRIMLEAPALEPSTISVIDARERSEVRNPEQDGVLLIIDASASMRDKLPNGKMKVSEAKAVIQDMVDNYLPAGIRFGLRVFGHRGGENCISELMIPVDTLNPEVVKQKLLFLRSSSLGNTALAEALSKAGEDMETLEGLKRVVVLTDGEETCQGDPAAVISDLAASGLEVTVNIVGFTLGDETVKAAYSSWVQATGGSYLDAQDVEALGEALKTAMTPVELPNYEIYDETGKLIASGKVDGESIKVDSGLYTVKILDSENPKQIEVNAFETDVVLKYQ
ncbi:MAG: VWA domain-containing protein [Opitutales bacterium]|nr:VWA domain-containing protein [Opitutales bacterium]